MSEQQALPIADLVTFKELVSRLKPFGIGPKWVRNESKAGRIPGLLAGKTFLYSWTAVEAALRARASGNAS
jgi:hypothetical protein